MPLKIQILSDDEFEALPYAETGISLGLADTNKGEAYVRYTANKELQEYLINHELEHLTGEDRDEIHHDGNGVYYKGFGNVLSGVGNAVGGAARSIGGAAQSVGSGISNAAGSLTKAMGFGGGFQGGANPSGGMAAAAASNPALRMPTTAGSAGGLSSLGQRLGQTMPSPNRSMQGFNPSSPLNSLMGAQPGNFAFQPPSTPKIGSPAPMATQGASMGGSTGQPTPAPKPQGPQTQSQGGGLDLFGKVSQGLGLGQQVMSMFGGQGGAGGFEQNAGIGSRLPDLSQLPSVQAYKNYDFRGNLSEMDPALQDAINRDFDKIDAEEEHEFRNRWKNIRPGADIENDSVFARDYKALKDSQATRRADSLAKYRLENVQTQLGVNELEAKRLQELAQLDVDTISFNTGMDAQEAMNLKAMFGYGTSEEGGTLGNISNVVGQVGNIVGGLG